MTKQEKTAESTGLMSNSGSQINGGITLLILGVILFLFEIFIIKKIFDSEMILIDNTAFLLVDRNTAVYMMIVTALAVSMLIATGISSLYYGAKSKKASYALGERHSVWIIRGTPGKSPDMYMEIRTENRCPGCNTDLGGLNPRYCPKCGQSMDEETAKAGRPE